MEEQPYVSCIKINGIPILPPIMSEDIRKEMSHYKSLAIAVERKLKTVDVGKRVEMKHLRDSDDSLAKETHCTDVDEAIESDTESVSFDSTSNIESVLLGPTQTDKNNAEEQCVEEPVPLEPKFTEQQSQSGIVVRNESNFQNVAQTIDSAMSGSESVTMSTDINRYLNTSNNTEAKSSTSETTPEIWKPRVPKTLNIIPISLENSNKDNNEDSSTSETPKDEGETPKLVRQGSYILDTPSPMLLAHMQTELANAEYVPNPRYCPTPTTNTIRRKEWNISQAKAEWENQTKYNKIIVSETPRESNRLKCHRNHSFPSQRACKPPCQQAKSQSSLEMYRSTRSVDCIQAMLAKEYVDKTNNKIISQNEKVAQNGSAKKKSRMKRNVSTFNLANKLGGSLGNLNSGDAPIYKRTDTKQEEKSVETTRRSERIIGIDNAEKSTSKLKPVITSEKLLAIFQEIEDVHKKQMNELMMRQQKEQNLLEQEFEKQQLLILSEIRKTFPAISLKLLSKDFPSTTPDDQTIHVNGKIIEDDSLHEKKSSSQTELRIHSPPNGSSTPPCPLNYLYPKDSFYNVKSHLCKLSQSTETQTETLPALENFALSRNTDPKIFGSRYKCSSVSRQLFPLDTKSTHVPVLDSSVYTEKHARAATKINAYTKGYLVRRMMQTDRVIALKNTYKEALHCMLKLHIDAPLNLSELNFLHRLQLQVLMKTFVIFTSAMQHP